MKAMKVPKVGSPKEVASPKAGSPKEVGSPKKVGSPKLKVRMTPSPKKLPRECKAGAEKEAKRELMKYLGYNTSDKCKNTEAKEQAQGMLQEYKSLTGEMANQFAKKFMETRKTKDFVWANKNP